MRVNETEYQDGYGAGCDGLMASANPHRRMSGMHHAWHQGWCVGHYQWVQDQADKAREDEIAALKEHRDAVGITLSDAVALVFLGVLLTPFIGLIWSLL